MLAQNIKKARNDRHLSQRALADIIGVSQQTVGSWEVGRTSPDNEMLKKLAAFFKVSVDYLLGRTDEPQGTGFQKGLLGNINSDSHGGWQNMSLDDDDDSMDTESQKLLADYRQLDEKARETIKSMIEISLRKKANSDD